MLDVLVTFKEVVDKVFACFLYTGSPNPNQERSDKLPEVTEEGEGEAP